MIIKLKGWYFKSLKTFHFLKAVATGITNGEKKTKEDILSNILTCL